MEFPLPPAVLPPEQQSYIFPRRPDGPDKDWVDENGNFQTEEIDLYVTCYYFEYIGVVLTNAIFPRSPIHTIPWFVELCQRFGLAHSGTKTARRERLVKFSQAGVERWKAKCVHSC